MKNANEVLKIKSEKIQQRIKENANRINEELMHFEKALNKYEGNIEDDKPYITVDTIIKTDEVKSLLKQNGYYIDKISDDIEVNTTRVYLDEKSYKEAIKYKNIIVNSINGVDINSLGGTIYNTKENTPPKNDNANKIKAEEWIDTLIYLGQLQKEYYSKR